MYYWLLHIKNGYFQTTEFKNDKINYPRYLFYLPMILL